MLDAAPGTAASTCATTMLSYERYTRVQSLLECVKGKVATTMNREKTSMTNAT